MKIEDQVTIDKKENLYTKDCIRTYTGIYVNVFFPQPEMFNIEDIAHSLTNQCRFGGHLPFFYSVARHSLNCAYLIDNPKLKLAALLHDASEAYLLDIPRPIKNNLIDYKQIENKLMIVLAHKFGFEYPLQKEIKAVDEIMLQLEWDCLMLRKRSWDFPTDNLNTKEDFISLFNYITTSQEVNERIK